MIKSHDETGAFCCRAGSEYSESVRMEVGINLLVLHLRREEF